MKTYLIALWVIAFVAFSSANGAELELSEEEKAQILELRKAKEDISKEDIEQLKKIKEKKQASEEARKNANKLKSGGFMGVHIGGGLPYSCSGVCPASNGNRSISISSATFIMGLKGGYVHFFSHYFGLRGYGQFDYGSNLSSDISGTSSFKISEIKQNFYALSGNVDMLAEFAFGSKKQYGFGLIAGLGYGYLGYEDNFFLYKQNKGGLFANIGLSFVFLHKHRIEGLARYYPLKNVNTSGIDDYGNPKSELFSSWSGLLAYSYTF